MAELEIRPKTHRQTEKDRYRRQAHRPGGRVIESILFRACL